MLVGGVGRVGGDQHGVAVGRRARRGLRGDHPARPSLVVHDDGLLGVAGDGLTERPGELVGGTAGREGHDESDRLLGVLGLRGCGQSEGRGKQGGQQRGSAPQVRAVGRVVLISVSGWRWCVCGSMGRLVSRAWSGLGGQIVKADEVRRQLGRHLE
jgi:hypothetical protein